MNDLTNKTSSPILAAGGAGFLVLAGVFLVRDLSLPPQILLGALAVLAGVAALLPQPRRWPWLAPAALLALAVIGGGWYLAVTSRALLPALGLTALGSIAAVARHERRASGTPGDLAGQLAWYAAGVAFLAATAALYFHFVTLGLGYDSVARRLIPTVAWLAIGLALLIAAPRRASAPARVGVGFVAVAVLKALIYDSTHLQGALRVTVFAAVGVLLLAGARLIANRERA